MDQDERAPAPEARDGAMSNKAAARLCPSCGYANPSDHAFCGKCGKSLVPSGMTFSEELALANPPLVGELDLIQRYMPLELLRKIVSGRGKIEGERREVTVLVVDMQGYTALAESLGEDVLYQFMNPIYELMITSVHRYEGTVQKLTGDGMLALFGAPVALENAPVSACRAALDIQAQIDKLGNASEARYGVRPRLRIGIHSGPVVVGSVGTNLRMEFEVVGDSVNLAARLQALAEPGSILLSETTQRLVEGYAQCTFVGERMIKGKVAPQRVYRLDGLDLTVGRFDASIRRGLTPLVGRNHELALLERCYKEVCQGNVRFVDIVGEAGLGKSRLLHELHQRVERDRVLFLQGHCRADGQSTAFLPFLEVLRTAFHLNGAVSRFETEQRLHLELEQLGVQADLAVPLCLNLMGVEISSDALRGLDGEIIGTRTRELLHSLLRAWCRRGPLVVAIEDLHWIDAASEGFLLLASRIAETLPLLIVCTYRGIYRPPWTSHCTLTVEALSQDSTAQLLRHRVGAEALPADLVSLIADKAEGNPLVAEEIVGYMLATSALQIKADGIAFRPSGDLQRIPTTLQHIVMARLDHLSETHRTVAQAASVIGRRFSMALLAPVAGVNGQLPSYVRDLEAQELCSSVGDSKLADYQFKHALVHDVIYNSMLEPRREALHQHVGEAIEQIYADRLGEWVEMLAHHYRRTPPEKAVYYHVRAAEKSLRLYALDEAERHFREAWKILETVPSCADDLFLAELLLGWARLHYYRKDFKALIALLEPYRPRIERCGDLRRLSLFLFWLGYSYSFGAHAEQARQLLDASLALGEQGGDEECIGYACMALMWMYSYWGRTFDALRDIVERLGERALAIGKRLGDVYLVSKCLLCLWSHRLNSGRLAQAREFGIQLVDLGREAGDPRTVAVGLWALGFVNALEERYDEAIANAEESLRVSPDPLDHLTARGVLGFALALKDPRASGGLTTLQDVRRELVAGGYLYPLAGIDMACGGAMALAGQMSAGVRWLEEAIERFWSWGNTTQPAFGHMLLAEIYLEIATGKQKPPLRVMIVNLGFLLRTVPVARRKALHHFQQAIRIARDFDVPGTLARSLLGLGLLHQAEKRWAEARTCLEEAHQIALSIQSSILEERSRLALKSCR